MRGLGGRVGLGIDSEEFMGGTWGDMANYMTCPGEYLARICKRFQTSLWRRLARPRKRWVSPIGNVSLKGFWTLHQDHISSIGDLSG